MVLIKYFLFILYLIHPSCQLNDVDQKKRNINAITIKSLVYSKDVCLLRLLCIRSRIEYRDDEISEKEWNLLQNEIAGGALPIIEFQNELPITQPSALILYIGLRSSTLPDDPVGFIRTFEYIYTIEDIFTDLLDIISRDYNDGVWQKIKEIKTGQKKKFEHIQAMTDMNQGKYFFPTSVLTIYDSEEVPSLIDFKIYFDWKFLLLFENTILIDLNF